MSGPIQTDDFINELVAVLQPVRRVPTLAAWVLRSLLVACATVVCALVLLGARDNFTQHILSLSYLTPAIMFFALACISVFAARFFSIPGNDDSRTLPVSAMVVAAAWLAIIAYEIFRGHSDSIDDGIACTCNMFAFSLPMYLILAHLVYRAAPIRLRMAGLSVSAAGASIGALCSYLVCSSDSALHVFVWHFLPFFALGCSGIFLSSFFDWQRRSLTARPSTSRK